MIAGGTIYVVDGIIGSLALTRLSSEATRQVGRVCRAHVVILLLCLCQKNEKNWFYLCFGILELALKLILLTYRFSDLNRTLLVMAPHRNLQGTKRFLGGAVLCGPILPTAVRLLRPFSGKRQLRNKALAPSGSGGLISLFPSRY